MDGHLISSTGLGLLVGWGSYGGEERLAANRAMNCDQCRGQPASSPERMPQKPHRLASASQTA